MNLRALWTKSQSASGFHTGFFLGGGGGEGWGDGGVSVDVGKGCMCASVHPLGFCRF